MAVAEYVRMPQAEHADEALARKLQELWETKPGLFGWISTVDHKEIGIRYIVTAFAFLIVGGIVVALALLTEVRYQPPIWLHLVLWLPLTVVLVLGLMRPFKATLIALQYKHRRHDFTEGADGR